MTKRKRRNQTPGPHSPQSVLEGLPDEIKAVLESARRNQQGTPPRKHHLIPSSYLQNWADDGQIRVTHIDEDRRTYKTAPKKAARETDYYSLAARGLDPEEVPPILAEMALEQIEEWGTEAMAHLIEYGAADCPAQLAAKMAWFLGHQLTRGETFRREQRSLAHDLFVLQHQGMTDKGIRQMLIERGLDSTAEQVALARVGLDQILGGEVHIAPQDATLVGTGFKIAVDVGETFLNRGWLVYRTAAVLITCDEPVVIIGGPGADRSERAGLATAAVVIFPLSPTTLLAMFRSDLDPAGPATLTTEESLDVNREILGNATRWAFERPSRKTTTRLAIPPPALPFAMEGPLPYQSAAKTESVLYRNYKPTRWASEPTTPWPVPRWYRQGSRLR